MLKIVLLLGNTRRIKSINFLESLKNTTAYKTCILNFLSGSCTITHFVCPSQEGNFTNSAAIRDKRLTLAAFIYYIQPISTFHLAFFVRFADVVILLLKVMLFYIYREGPSVRLSYR